MAALDLKHQTIAVLPGTSNMGSHLFFQLTKKYLSIVMGSQDPAKAQQLADQISKEMALNSVRGVSNAEAAIASDIIIWCPAVTYKSLLPVFFLILRFKCNCTNFRSGNLNNLVV
jgi:predicted dinucleotide-binding enzyme